MTETALTADRIIEAAEDALRRFGLSKATVVDVARALGVSHGSVYRHFPSKVALRDAVAKRWLARVSEPLELIALDRSAPDVRLRAWFDALITLKHGKALDDPELFATYMSLAAEVREVVDEHVQTLVVQVAHIIRDGIESGDFAVADSLASARAVLNATARFHNPIHAAEWTHPGIHQSFDEVWALVLRGLSAAR